MRLMKRAFLYGLMAVTLGACGGGDSGSAGQASQGETTSDIVGSWVSPCTTVTIGGGVLKEYLIATASFNSDKTIKYFIQYYQEDSCQNVQTTGNITMEGSGTYVVGAATTAHDGAAATDLDVSYSTLNINGNPIPTYSIKPILTVYRVIRNTFYAGEFGPLSVAGQTRSNFIQLLNPYTRK